MKKKLSLYFYFIFMNCFSCIAQTYTPFPTSDAIWTSRVNYLAQDLPVSIEYQILMSGIDTIINTTKYKKIKNRGSAREISAIRELDRKIYIRVNGDDKDSLLYDFNLKLGDTLNSAGFRNSFIVTKIDSIIVNNSVRKRYAIRYKFSTLSFDYLIEGIGCTCGFIPYPFIFESGGRLLCHSVGNQQIFGGETGQCLLLSNKNPQIELAKIKIAPNPIIDVGQMEIPNDAVADNIKVYDYLGRMMYATAISQNSVPISAKDYTAGLYFVHIYNKQTLVGISKFVVE